MAVFKVNSSDSSIEVSAHNVPLKIKPLRIKSASSEVPADMTDLRFAGRDKLQYVRLFGGKGTLEYSLEEQKLKESIIFEDISDFSPLEEEPSTSTEEIQTTYVKSGDDLESSPAHSTVSVEFSLIYPENAVLSLNGSAKWGGETVETKDDIHFIQNRQPHTIYAVNEFYRIKAPYLEDAKGKRINLTYTLQKNDGWTSLQLNIPPTDSLKFPITVDPTIIFNDDVDGYEWHNTDSCSTASSACDAYVSTSNMYFKIPSDCNTSGQTPVRKPLFVFHTGYLYNMYSGGIYYAQMLLNGSCASSSMHSNEDVYLYAVDPVYETPDPSWYSDEGKEQLSSSSIMDKNNCYCDFHGCSRTITTYFDDAVSIGADMGFELDISPARNDTDKPSGNIYYNVYDNEIKLRYAYHCSETPDCPGDEFCKAGSPDLCEEDLPYNASCEGVAVDDDNEACPTNHCRYDDFDGSGHYCTHSNVCVNDGIPYSHDYIHCEGSSWYKTCLTNDTWSTQTNCGWGCDEGTGCATTTTTTSTTTTIIVTTTLPPNILVTPTQLQITIIR